MKRFTRRQILYLIFILIVIVLFLPIKIPYRFQVTAVVYPLQEWYLKRGQDDSYTSEIKNYRTDVLDCIKSYKFNRGDISTVRLIPNIQAGSRIGLNDTIAHIQSYFIANELVRLNNKLDVELKALEVKSSGKKQALIEQSIQEFSFAKQQFDLEQKKFQRQVALYADSIISPEKFEEAENAFKLAKINIEIARQKMLADESGGKSEEIQLIEQRLKAVQLEINTLKDLESQYIIVSPIAGVVSFYNKENEIISISDTSEYILKIPVVLKDLPYLKRIKAIRFSVPGQTDELDAKFLAVESNVKFLDNRQMALARALVKNGQVSIYPGMTVQCQVICDDISLFTYLKRGIKINL